MSPTDRPGLGSAGVRAKLVVLKSPALDPGERCRSTPLVAVGAAAARCRSTVTTSPAEHARFGPSATALVEDIGSTNGTL
jgi:hypothetical protein